MGGAPVSLLMLLASLDERHFHPSAVFTEAGPILEHALRRGVHADVVPTGGAFFYSAHARLAPRMLARFIGTFPSAVARARRTLRSSRPDVLHLNTSVLLAWAVAARRERVPVVWTVREVLGPDPLVRRWHAGFIVRHASRVVAISDAVRASFSPALHHRVERVYNAVDLPAFDPRLHARRDAIRRQLGLAASDAVVAAIGSVQVPKGHWILLDALGILSGIESRVRLMLVCGGVDDAYRHGGRGRIKSLLGVPLDNLDRLLGDAAARGLRDRIVVTGFRDDIARMLAAADLLAFPSLSPEGFGRPIMEAMAMEVPVVATDVGPSREILGTDAGVLVPPEADAVARALLHLWRDEPRRERLGRAGRARVERLFTLSRQVPEMERIYIAAAGDG